VSDAEPTRPGILRGRSVFLSASIPVRPGFRRVSGAAVEIEEAVISFARAVLREEGIVVFGAHPSISPLVASVASEYLTPRLRNDPPPEVEQIGRPERSGPGVVIYQSHAYDGYVPDKTWELYRMGYADLVWCREQAGEKFEPREKRVQCPESLRFMRQKMFEKESPTAMVAIGGMEGVIEEAKLFLESKNQPDTGGRPSPLYVMSTTGGAAEILAREPMSGWPRHTLHLVEQEWSHAVGVTPTEPRADPRARPFVPYPVIMQWLVQQIAHDLE
jgi:SLOG cluster3 family